MFLVSERISRRSSRRSRRSPRSLCQCCAMATLAEKQTVPASDNRTPNSLFFISQSSIQESNISRWASTETYEGETQSTVNAQLRFQDRTFGEALNDPYCGLDALPG